MSVGDRRAAWRRARRPTAPGRPTRATNRFRGRRMKRRAGWSDSRGPGTTPATPAPHGRRLRAALADAGRALRGGPYAPFRVSRHRRCPYRGERLATVRHRRVPEVPPLWGAGPRLRPGALRRLRVERLVPFSCKGRGFCPSCGGRRMAERAAHLLNAVLPWVPVRQWVLTKPYPPPLPAPPGPPSELLGRRELTTT